MKTTDRGAAVRTRSSSGLLKRLKLWQKFALLAIMVAPAALVPAIEYYSQTKSDIDFAQTEERGLEPSTTLIKLIQLIQQHRGLSAALAGGNQTVANERQAKEAEINEVTAKIDGLLKGVNDKPIMERWGKNKSAFAKISRDMANRSAGTKTSYGDHTQLIDDELLLLEAIVAYYKLNLDPDAHTHYLIQASLAGLPALTESFGQIRAFGAGLLADAKRLKKGSIGPAEHLEMVTLIAEGRKQSSLMERYMQKVFAAVPRLTTEKVAIDLKVAQEASKRLLDLAQAEVADSANLTFDSAEFVKRFTQGINEQFALAESAANTTRVELENKIRHLREEQLLDSGIILALFAIALALGAAISRSVLRPVSHLQAVMKGLRQGDSSLRAHLDSTDEVGELAKEFDTMVDEREAIAAKIKKENDVLNESIIDILRAVAKTAQGDLTVHAPVREDVTGALSDAINSMAEATGKTLLGVNEVSEELRRASQKGAETVRGTAKGMNEIRGTIQETGKRIKRLGERSQEIGGIVKVINEIAERTSVLALNANMQAAMAGEAGRGFRVVADEVQRLAERSKEATDQISKLVSGIQGETNETINTMDRAISEVVMGGKLAEEAADQVAELEKLGDELIASVRAFKLPGREAADANDSAGGRRVA